MADYKMPTQILPHIVSQHAEDSAFLWLQRDQAVHAPQFNLKELAILDSRVEAHIDGLRIAGDARWAICDELLPLEDAGEVFVRGLLALENASTARVDKIIEKAGANWPLARGLVSALGWMPVSAATPYISSLVSAGSSGVRRIGVAAGAIQRAFSGSEVMRFLDDADPLVRARACRAAGELGVAGSVSQLRSCLASDHESCRFHAAWSLALLGEREGLPLLFSTAEASNSLAGSALQMAVRVAEVSVATEWLRKIRNAGKDMRLAIKAAGALGDPAAIDWLIELMMQTPLSRLAAESFTFITGADLDRQYLKGEPPKDFAVGPSEDPTEDNVEMDPDENLPWPLQEAVKKWWAQHRGEWLPGKRYLLGQPLDSASLQKTLLTGRQRQRAAAALELAIQQHGILFEVRAPGFAQLRSTSEWTSRILDKESAGTQNATAD